MDIYWQLTNGEKLIYGKRIWSTQEKRYAYYTYLFSSYFKSIDQSLVDFSLSVFLIYNTVLPGYMLDIKTSICNNTMCIESDN